MHLANVKVQLLLGCLALMVLHVESLRACGNELSQLLAAACNNGFNSRLKRFNVKPDSNALGKADQDLILGDMDTASDLDLDSPPLLRILLGESAPGLLYTRRRRFGPPDECCRKSCTFNEILNYCKPA